MSYFTSQLLSKYHYLSNHENTCAEIETELDCISSIWDDDQIPRLNKKTGNAYGVIKVSK